MKKEVGLFVLVVVVVAAIAGAVIVKGKTNSNTDQNAKNTAQADTNSDDGTVAGANSNDEQNPEDTADYKEKLAKALTEKGAVFYGAYWCPHCKDQKALFGDAMKYVNYVECDPAGENANPDECKAKGVDGYPTWIYNGQQYGGTQSLSKLAQMINFVYLDGTQGGDPSTSGNAVDSSATDQTAPTAGQTAPAN